MNNTDPLIESKNPPQQAIIFLHGYGADGHDLISLHEYFEDGQYNTIFCSPHAPNPCEQDHEGRQWFSLIDWSPHTMIKGAQESVPYLVNYVESIKQKYHLNENQITLVGFSQGTMMALYTALHEMPNLKAVVGFSGLLLILPETKRSISPILLIHGDQDQVVPIQESIKANQLLTQNNYNVRFVPIRGLAHGIDPQGLKFAQEFLQNCSSHETIK